MFEGSTCSLGLPSRLAVSSCALDDQSLRFSFGPRVPASRLELRLPGSSIAGVSPEYRRSIAGVSPEYRRSIAGVSPEYRWSIAGVSPEYR